MRLWLHRLVIEVRRRPSHHRARWELEPWRKVGGSPEVERDEEGFPPGFHWSEEEARPVYSQHLHEITGITSPGHAVCVTCGAKLTFDEGFLPWATGAAADQASAQSAPQSEKPAPE